ncbi:LysR family transcriptional regulator [Nocardia carnea]|uniref:LysR family transcriptional regulator n=1 Tax=Nocardia carnea TaxID=37328 RepID=A0ABW7TH92_9NOCA|nr:LysR family transcriptional regulator [Nocardia carnea]
MTAGWLRNLDLNLLTTLDALLTERNVTRAAENLGLSQPAVSAALRRLRRHFHDELLHRSGNRYELTPLAEQLREPAAAALVGIQRVFDAVPAFDPATSSREFTVLVSDYAATVFCDQVATVLAEQAPGVRLRLDQQTGAHIDQAPESLRTADGTFLPHGFLTDLPSIDVFTDSWVLIVSADNTEVGDTVTLEQLAELPWVVTYHAPTAFTPAARQLRMIGIEPDIRVVVQSFLAVPFMVTGTRCVALLQRRLADRLAAAANVRVIPCPWEVVPLVEAFWWHPTHRADPAHQWLRSVLTEVSAGAALN